MLKGLLEQKSTLCKPKMMSKWFDLKCIANYCAHCKDNMLLIAHMYTYTVVTLTVVVIITWTSNLPGRQSCYKWISRRKYSDHKNVILVHSITMNNSASL